MGDPNIIIHPKGWDNEENPDKWSSSKEYDMRVGEDDKRCASAIRGAYMDHSKLRFCIECCFKKPVCAEPIHSPCVNPARVEAEKPKEEAKPVEDKSSS
jgi:hypothetical protein